MDDVQIMSIFLVDACVMFLNVLGGLALLFGVGDVYTFGLSIVYLVVFTPFAYICWFRPIYKAFRFVWHRLTLHGHLNEDRVFF